MIPGTTFDFADIDAAWPRVVLRATLARSDALEDYQQRCRAGDALCLICDDGLVILSLQVHASGRMAAVVLLAVSLGEPNAFKRHEEELVKIARDLDAEELTFQTDRRGWLRLLGSHWHGTPDIGFSRRV